MRVNLSLLISACILLASLAAIKVYQIRTTAFYNSEVENNFAMITDTLVSQIVSDVSVEDYDAVRDKITKTLGFNQQVQDVLILLRDDLTVFYDLGSARENTTYTGWLKEKFIDDAVAAALDTDERDARKAYREKHLEELEEAAQAKLDQLEEEAEGNQGRHEKWQQEYTDSLRRGGLVYLSASMVLKTGLGFGLTYGEEKIGTLWIGVRHEDFLKNERLRSMVNFAYSLTQNVSSSVSEGDYVRVRDMMGNMVGDRKNIEYAELLHADGTILFYSKRGMKREDAQEMEGTRAGGPLRRNALMVMGGLPLKIQNATVDGNAVMDIAVPVENEDKRVGVVRIGYSIEDFLRAQQRTKVALGAAAVGFFMVGLIIAFLLSTRIASPIRQLASAAERVKGGDMEAKVNITTGGRETRELGLAFNGMLDGLKERDFVKDTFSRYVTKQVADEILKDPDAVQPGGTRKEVTILFSDIRGFTTISERYSPEEVISLLNEYLSAMVDIIFKHEGTLDKFIGDAIMAVFGSPLPHEDDPLRAVRTA